MGGSLGKRLDGRLGERVGVRLRGRLDKINKYRLVESDNTIQVVLYMGKRISEKLDEL